MSLLNAAAQQNVGESSARMGTSIANSSFLEKNGHIVGVMLAISYLCITAYIIKEFKDKEELVKNKLLMAGLAALVIIALSTLLYYAKNKDDEDKAKINSTVANIALIPLYITIAIIAIVIIMNMK
jgi:hypothetical protein